MKGGAAIGKGVSGYMDAGAARDAAFLDSEEKRLKELQRREELGTLGFTGEEQNRMMRNLLNPIQAREAQRSVETRQILGAGDLGASQSAITNMIQADKGEAARAGASETYLQEQMAEKRLQETELRDLQKQKEAADLAEKEAKRQVIFSGISENLPGIVTNLSEGALYRELLGGQPAADASAARGQGGEPPLTFAQFKETMELTEDIPGDMF
jgi:multidrug resistance efflux pump